MDMLKTVYPLNLRFAGGWGGGRGYKTTCDEQISIQVAQRATIAHLSPMCQGKILFKKTTEKKWKHHFPHYKSMGGFLRRSRAANSAVGGPTWPKFELIHNIMHVLVTSKFEKRSDQYQRRLRNDIDFLDAQGQLTP